MRRGMATSSPVRSRSTIAQPRTVCGLNVWEWRSKTWAVRSPVKLHDFGYRGVSSSESAAICGAAHLVTFKGTDTLPALRYLHHHYGMREVCGFSIPASEHSTMTSHGGPDFEVEAFRQMLDAYPSGMFACVSDSYDIYRACGELWGGVLRDRVMSRDGTLIIRPDSGDPLVVLPKVLDILAAKFGYRVNDKIPTTVMLGLLEDARGCSGPA